MTTKPSEHQLSVAEVGYMYQATCSCGWKGRQFSGEVGAEREADTHKAETVKD